LAVANPSGLWDDIPQDKALLRQSAKPLGVANGQRPMKRPTLKQ
jgi:hypothetical protein